MALLRSFRTRLQLALVSIGLVAIVLTGWESVAGASRALEEATFARLTAIRETKRLQIEGYFRDLSSHVRALSADETATDALLAFRTGWSEISPASSREADRRLREFYIDAISRRMERDLSPNALMQDWFPANWRQIALQNCFLAENPHPLGAKDLLVDPGGFGSYGRAHQRYHPTFHRYLNSFGFYDILLIDAAEGRILYTVLKEIDLGASLRSRPYERTTLAKAFERALVLEDPDATVIEDYVPYAASYFAPAAFVAAPVKHGGITVGVLAIQVSIAEVNRMVTADRGWRETGMGDTGQAYIVGRDGKLRSDARVELEQEDEFLAQLRQAGMKDESINRIRRNGTGILTLSASEGVMDLIERSAPVTEVGKDFRGIEVLRSFAPLRIPGLDWFVVAEIETAEAFAPLAGMQRRMAGIGALIAVVFFVIAWFLGGTVTQPVLALVEGTRKLKSGDFSTRLEVRSQDEIGELGASFNRMADELERTTVSRSKLDAANQQLRLQQKELEALAARLIRAQEDERSRIARELHDDFTQRLAAVAIELGKLERQKDYPPAGAEKLGTLRDTMAAIASDVHSLSRSLHPSMLKELGLGAALEQEFRAFFERGGPPVHFVCSGELGDVPDDVRLGVYRLVQEALQNVLRHAEASEVEVRLERTSEVINLHVVDDGRGFQSSAVDWQPGLGLASMRERVHLLGGSFALRSDPGQGTTITAVFPLETAGEGGMHDLA